jgi:hypothetical protein
MIAPFGTGPTSFAMVLWDQAESDSFPQTMPGYYGCATLSHVNSWRELLRAPTLPWMFVHLQPYTGSENGASDLEVGCGALYGDALAELRHNQLNALQLPHTGFASAIDLGDPTSPYGNVHFQNKQVLSKRLVSAAMHVAFGKEGGSGGAVEYPPAQFLTQTPSNSSCSMTIKFFKKNGASSAFTTTTTTTSPSLAFGATPDPASNSSIPRSSAICPYPGNIEANCSGFEILCTTREVPHNPANPYDWMSAGKCIDSSIGVLVLRLGIRR